MLIEMLSEKTLNPPEAQKDFSIYLEEQKRLAEELRHLTDELRHYLQQIKETFDRRRY